MLKALIILIMTNKENTHKCYIDDNFGNCKILCAMKK